MSRSSFLATTPRTRFLAVILTVGISVFFYTACRPQQSASGSATATVEPTPTVVVARGNPNTTSVPAPTMHSALDTIRQSGTVRFGILFNDPPFAFLADNGDIHGLDVDLAKKIADQWGVQPTFVQVTRQTRIPALESGKIDVVAGSMPHRRELSQFVEFTDSTFLSGIGILASNNSGINSVTDLNGKTVGLVGAEAQDAWNQYSSKSGITATAQAYPDTSAALSAFSGQGGPNALVGRREDLMLAVTSLNNVRILDDMLTTEPYAFAVRRGDTSLRDLLDLTLESLAKSGQFAQIYSANLYGNAPADAATLYGDPAYTPQNFPVNLDSGESAVARIKRGEALRVTGYASTTPPAAYDGQAIVDGFNRAIVNELARRWNVPINEVAQTSGSAAIDALKAGQVDLVVGVRPDLALFGQVALSEGYYQRSLRLIHMQGVTLLGIDDLQFKSVMIVEPMDIARDLVTKNSQYAKVTTAPSDDDAFKSLTGGTTYALVGDEFTLMLMSQADNRIDVFKKRYRPTEYVMALPANDPDFINLMNFTLQDMKLDGTLDRVAAQYFAPYSPADDPPPPFSMEIWPGDGSYLGVGEH